MKVDTKIGAYHLHPVETGRFALDGGAMFGVVPKNLWNKTNPADEQNRITLAMRCLLLVSDDGKKILIDNGVGNKYNEKFASMYRIDHSVYTLERSLQKYDLTPNDITDVILTHLHFDHAGGSTKMDEQGRIVAAFPNAKYYVQKKHYEWGEKASEKDRASFLKPDYEPLVQSGQLQLIEQIDGIFPNITFFIANGHSPYQQLPIIHDAQHTVFFCGDLIPTTTHIAVPYVMAYDNQPLVTIAEKKDILIRAFENRWILFFEHDPETAMSGVRRDEKGFRMGDIVAVKG
ncbi:MBL fold metallo-hydrolase [bacterium]|nr:MBL fold metallo-hydrolase [bacterium]NUN44463.1 MBL fold metallo-hydrolase [bacterium]